MEDHHADDEILESYTLGRLAGGQMERLEEHLLICESCRVRLQEIEKFVQAFREAAAELFGPVTYVHRIDDTPLYLQLSRVGRQWRARLWGAEVESERMFPEPRAAHQYLRRTFAELYPEHRCGDACGPVPAV